MLSLGIRPGRLDYRAVSFQLLMLSLGGKTA